MPFISPNVRPVAARCVRPRGIEERANKPTSIGRPPNAKPLLIAGLTGETPRAWVGIGPPLFARRWSRGSVSRMLVDWYVIEVPVFVESPEVSPIRSNPSDAMTPPAFQIFGRSRGRIPLHVGTSYRKQTGIVDNTSCKLCRIICCFGISNRHRYHASITNSTSFAVLRIGRYKSL